MSSLNPVSQGKGKRLESDGSLNPLAQAKGKRLECEICSKVATLSCVACKSTYYCDAEHRSQDWEGIHEKICPLIEDLRKLAPEFGSDAVVRRNATVRKNQMAIVKIASTEATKQLSLKNYERAIPGGLQVLRYSTELHGASKPEILSAYLLLAEANLGLKRDKVAEEHLIHAHYIILHNDSVSSEVRSRVHRNFGRLFTLQQRYEEALTHLATDVYCAAQCYGANHISTAGGYVLMAEAFNYSKDRDSALAFFDKVVEIWYSFLGELKDGEKVLSAEIYSSGTDQLRSALQARSAIKGPNSLATAQARHVLGMMHHYFGHSLKEARTLYIQALEVYLQQLGDKHESTLNVRRVVDLLEGQYPSVKNEP
jgi:tetratricopeptide (TPR) repeat protein